MKRLLDIARALRDPETGCAWDLAQDFLSFREHLVGEAAEVVRAIEDDDHDNLCEELGDTLFNLCFLVNLAEEKGYFTLEDVIAGAARKMIGRHPHVFGGERAATPEEAARRFYEAKEREKPGKGQGPVPG